MKKVLILAYDFPPYVSVGGLRPSGWYKYFHEFGLYPVVVTRQWSNKYGDYLDYIAPTVNQNAIIEQSDTGTIIRTPYVPSLANKIMLKHGKNKYSFIRTLITAYYEIAQHFFITGTKSQLYISADEYLKKNKVDCIIATADPFALFSFAAKLSKKHGIPWIADYRDPWSDDISMQKNRILKALFKFIEKKTVKKASHITTVSELLKLDISKLAPGKQIKIICNGYDPEAIESVKSIEQSNETLTIALMGTIYKWHPTKIFLSVLSKFIANNKNVKLILKLYGINAADEINEMLASDYPNLKKHVSIFPKMPNNLLLKELANANLFLLFNYYSYMGTKIYDYIGLKRPILLCFDDDKEAIKLKEKYYLVKEEEGISKNLQKDLILDTNSGYIVKDAEKLYGLLEQLYAEFKETGKISCNTKNTENYSRKNQIKILANLTNDISS